MSIRGVKGHTKSWAIHEPNQQWRGNESIAIAKSQRIQKEDNARINQVSAMRPGLASITEKYILQTIRKVLKPTIREQRMRGVFSMIMLGHQNKFNNCQKSTVQIVVLTIIDLNTQ